ncbi:hypothetical protein DSL72_007321 [Monilinia vaccinii-corymbosi]|uniref:Ras family protein n=1 Tax=Monilinia vaccinii-corymbosi TaxID=61207 RepID=A0A8A3PMY7_9HELO|nr:hypothetical protein DSL72_007321 [Monilinia vaccinii-corymbosi]
MDQPPTYDATLEDSHRKVVTVDAEECVLEISEANYVQAGSMLEQYIRGSDGIILMYSICSAESFSVLESLWTTVKRVRVPEKRGFYVDIVGTMSDMWEKRSVKTGEGKALAERLDCGFSECSAKEGENCEGVIENLIRKIVVGREQERILRDARRKKEGDEIEEREKKEDGLVKRAWKRYMVWLSRRF